MDHVERVVIPKVSGYVTYDIKVKCPHCSKSLQLNQFPYVEDDEFGRSEDELGSNLFGSEAIPAKWKDFEIEYRCCGCKKQFIINEFEL